MVISNPTIQEHKEDGFVRQAGRSADIMDVKPYDFGIMKSLLEVENGQYEEIARILWWLTLYTFVVGALFLELDIKAEKKNLSPIWFYHAYDGTVRPEPMSQAARNFED
jgi:hypothetical protein